MRPVAFVRPAQFTRASVRVARTVGDNAVPAGSVARGVERGCGAIARVGDGLAVGRRRGVVEVPGIAWTGAAIASCRRSRPRRGA